MNGYYTSAELESFGFISCGENVLISKKASIYGAANISIGHDVRIDDFCILVGNIAIGSFVHVCAYTGLHASYGSIKIGDYSNLSSRVVVYAASDDYSGESMTNSVIPEKYKNILYGNVILGKHVIVGTGSTILHNAQLPDGVAIGAMSLVNKPLDAWTIYAGIPCNKLKDRSQKLMEYEHRFIADHMLTHNENE